MKDNIKGPILPKWANYWAESCGGNSKLADCFLIVITEEKYINQREAYNSLVRGIDKCDFRGGLWKGLQLLSSEDSEGLFTGRHVGDHLPQNFFSLITSTTEIMSRFSLAANNREASLVFEPRKFADYRPLIADLFPDILEVQETFPRYSHWAWTDIDVVYGDLGLFINLDVSSDAPHIQPVYFLDPEGWKEPTASGQLTVFRNLEPINHLWREISDVWNVLRDHNHVSFDEIIFGLHIFDLKGTNISRLTKPLVIQPIQASAMDMAACDAFLNRNDHAFYLLQGTGSIRLFRVSLCKNIEEHTEIVLFHFGCAKNNQEIRISSLTGTLRESTGSWPEKGWHLKRWNITSSREPLRWTFHDVNWGRCPVDGSL